MHKRCLLELSYFNLLKIIKMLLKILIYYQS